MRGGEQRGSWCERAVGVREQLERKRTTQGVLVDGTQMKVNVYKWDERVWGRDMEGMRGRRDSSKIRSMVKKPEKQFTHRHSATTTQARDERCSAAGRRNSRWDQ